MDGCSSSETVSPAYQFAGQTMMLIEGAKGRRPASLVIWPPLEIGANGLMTVEGEGQLE